MQAVEPRGLKLLKGPRRSYSFMVTELNKCCEENPNCSCQQECRTLFDKLCDSLDTRRPKIDYIPKRQTETQKYSIIRSRITLCP